MKILNHNHIKMLACILMLVDHVGYFLFPKIMMLRAIGRLAFPLFAYLIAEGCFYTRDKFKHLALMLTFGVICQVGIYFDDPNARDVNVILTFTCSVVMIYLLDRFKKDLFSKNWNAVWSGLAFIAGVLCFWKISTKFSFDYDFRGMLVPVICSIFYKIPECKGKKYVDNMYVRLVLLAIGMIMVAMKNPLGNMEYLSLLSIIILLFYNGKKGKLNLKYAFYVFYPAHIAIIYLIGMII